MRILVTGAAGFLGSHLSDRLVADGHEVVGLDDFSSGRWSNVTDLVGTDRFDLIKADVVDPLTVEPPLDRILPPSAPAPRAPAACSTWPPTRGQSSSWPPRARCTAGRTSIPRSRRTPAGSTRWGLAAPTARPNALRRVIPRFIARALSGRPLPVFGTGQQTRSFCYVSDMVEALLRLAETDYANPVNLGNPDEVRILDLAREILELTGSRSPLEAAPLPADDPPRRRPDVTLAIRVLGWRPTVSRRDGLQRTIAHFREHERLAGGS